MEEVLSKEKLLHMITDQVLVELQKNQLIEVKNNAPYIPVSISARHIHLQEEHIGKLFGEGYRLTKLKDISQPGQYACEESVTIVGPKGKIDRVRILGPSRNQTQLEIAASDARKIGVKAPVRKSGDLQDSSPITIIGPKGTVNLDKGCIIADRHIHMTPKDAEQYGVKDGQKVSVLVRGIKGGLMGEVTIRVDNQYFLDMHIDTDDANAFGLIGNEWLKLMP